MPQTEPSNSATERDREAAAEDKVEATGRSAVEKKPQPLTSPPPPPVKKPQPAPANSAEESKELIAGNAAGNAKVDKKEASGKNAAS